LMLYNNQNKYTSALLVPNGDALGRWAKNKNIDLTNSKGLEAVLIELDSVINQYMAGGSYEDLFPSRWLPAAIAILNEPFNSDNKQLNSLGKMVRAKIVERHKDKIDYMYSAEGKNIINPENLVAIRKVLGIN
jgi:long-chain acyl-CoA synthetase